MRAPTPCLFALLMALAGCSGNDEPVGAPCTPGEAMPCACADGASGQQVCDDSGARYGACMCLHVATTGAGGGASSSATGGGGASSASSSTTVSSSTTATSGGASSSTTATGGGAASSTAAMGSGGSTAMGGGGSSSTTAMGGGGFGGGFGGMSTNSSMGGLGGMSTGAGGCDHMGPLACNSASNLGSITGDDDSSPGPLIENGDTSAWFSIDVTEDSDFANSLSYAASLAYPSGVVFQVFAYDSSCNAAPISGTTTTPSQLCETWPDNFGTTDDRTIYFEVRYISGGACGMSATWTLTILGHSGSNCTQG